MLVIDASTTAAWAFKDETTAEIEAIFDQIGADGAVVPAIWLSEVANALLTGERRGRVTTAALDHVLVTLAALPIEIDGASPMTIWTSALSLAREHRLTVYDATYLELATRRGLSLATQDNDLRTAAQAIGVPLA